MLIMGVGGSDTSKEKYLVNSPFSPYMHGGGEGVPKKGNPYPKILEIT